MVTVPVYHSLRSLPLHFSSFPFLKQIAEALKEETIITHETCQLLSRFLPLINMGIAPWAQVWIV